MPLSAARIIISTHMRIGISLSSIGFSLRIESFIK